MRGRLTFALIAGTTLALAAGGAAAGVAGGWPDDVPGFVARVTVTDGAGRPVRGCSGALVERQWVLTAGQCLAGRTDAPVTVTVGATALAAASVVLHPERDVALVRLSVPVPATDPARLGAPAAPGETLVVAGWGRTATEWVPDRPHRADVRVDTVTDAVADLAPAGAETSVCPGDAGGPVLRGAEVVAVAIAGGQRHCLGAPDQAEDGARAVAVGDLTGWLLEATSAPVRLTGLTRVDAGRFTGDEHADVVAVESATGKLWLYPGTAAGHVLDRRVEIGRSGWNAIGRIAAGDFTGDGRSDLVAVETSTGKLFLYANTGRSGLDLFGARVEIGRSSWNTMGRLTAGDFSGDGRADLAAVQTSTGKLLLYVNTGRSGLDLLAGPGEIGRSGWNALGEVVASDRTGDGRADIVAVETATGKLFSYVNTGRSGLETLATRVEVGRAGWQAMAELAGGDLTGDGRQDLLAVVSGSGVALLYPGDGSGTSGVAVNTAVRQIG